MAKFDSKSFNEKAFGKYVDIVPKLKKNELVKSKALQSNSQIKAAFSGQTGVVYASIPMYGRIDGDALNYDGATDITATSTTTYERGVIVIGRAKAWVENDFSEDVTGGAGFMSNVARQVAEYWDEIDQDTLLAILEGIFSMTGAANLKFVNGHTYDISANVGATGMVAASTLNTAIQKASGDKKAKFTISIMHSVIATNLENLKLLAYMTYTDAQGIERQLELATWNGRAVLIDDGMPTVDVDAVYTLTSDTEIDGSKTYYTRSGSAGSYVYTPVASPVVGSIGTYYELTAEAYTKYTTYVLGNGAFDYEDIGAEVPYAMVRDEKTNGGQTLLYSRQRKVFAPYGISFTKSSMATNSPTDAELKNGANWELVHDGASSNKKYIDHKAIPIARIISRG
jgi:hypothetical protein